jgi:hypothetical protein
MLYEVNPTTFAETLMSKVGLQYDEAGTIQQDSAAPVQHDNINYSSTSVVVRGNLSSVKRYDVDNTSQFTTTTTKYNAAGSVVSIADPLTLQPHLVIRIRFLTAFRETRWRMPRRSLIRVTFPQVQNTTSISVR